MTGIDFTKAVSQKFGTSLTDIQLAQKLPTRFALASEVIKRVREEQFRAEHPPAKAVAVETE